MIAMMALVSGAQAATLEMALKDKLGTVTVPHGAEVTLTFAGGADGATTAKWTNTESDALGVICGKEGKAPQDDLVEQVMLQVGADKWALAPGSNVHFTCASGPVTVTDLHGTAVGTFDKEVTLSGAGVKTH
ncbi:MAG: hypothetical protein R3F59_28640 [Myxococcota bacterium]